MKINKIFLVSIFLLAVLTIGAVSAADDADTITAIDEGDETAVDSPAEEVELDGADENDVLSDDNYITARLDSDVVEYEGSLVVNVTISENVTGGTIMYYIDSYNPAEDLPAYDDILEEEFNYSEIIDLDYDIGFGQHTLYVNYTSGNYPDKIIKLPFTVSGFRFDVDWNEPSYGNDVIMGINIPNEAQGTVKVKLNGKTYTLTYDEDSGWGESSITINKTDIIYGNNTATVTFEPFNTTGNFKQKTITSTESILSYILVYSNGSDNFEYSRPVTVSLTLPQDAKGKLNICVDGENYTVSSNKGIYERNFTFSQLGMHEITAIYVGNDYIISYGEELELDGELTRQIEVYPKFDVTERIWINENISVSVEMPEQYNGKVTFMASIMDYDTLEEDTIELGTVQIINGKAAASYKVEGDSVSVYAIVNCSGYENSLPGCQVIIDYATPDLDFELNTVEVIRNTENQVLGEIISEEYFDYNFLLLIDDEDWGFDLDGDNIKIDATGLSKGKHTYKLLFLGDNYYLPRNITGTFEVGKFTVKIPDVNVMDDAGEIIIELPKNTKGTITVKVGTSIFFKGSIVEEAWVDDDLDGLYLPISLDGLPYGVKTVSVLYGSDVIATKKVNSTYFLGLEKNTVRYGGDKIEMIVPKGAEKTLSATIDGVKSQVSVVRDDGAIEEAYLIIPSDLAIGNHTVLIAYSGDKVFPEKSVILNIEVLPAIHVEETVVKGEGVSLVLPENAQGELIIKINNEEYKTVKVEDGVASVTFDDLPFGKYDIEAVYNGTDYDVGEMSETFTINPDFKVPERMVWGDDSTISLILDKDTEGTLVVMDEDSGDEFSKELVNGRASISLSSLGLGTRYLVVSFYHIYFDKDLDELVEDLYEINRVVTVINPIVAKDASVLYSQNFVYSVQIRDADGNPVDGESVTFTVLDGSKKLVEKTVAVKNGVAKLSYKLDKGVKTYKIKTTYCGVSVTKKLTVKHIVTLKKVTVKKSAKKLVITATLKKVNGKYLKNKRVVFKFNGKTYKNIKTNSKGVAKLTLKSTVLKKLKVGKKITYQATYNKDTVKQSVKVKK